MADGDLDTESTNSPLARPEAVIGVVLPGVSDHVARALASKTLPGGLLVCSVGSHALAETTVGAHHDAANLLEPERVHDVADRSLGAVHRRGGGILGERLGSGGGVVGLRGDLRLRCGELCFPDDIADDSAGSIAAVLQLLGDERGQDVRVQLRALELDQVEFDGLAVDL